MRVAATLSNSSQVNRHYLTKKTKIYELTGPIIKYTFSVIDFVFMNFKICTKSAHLTLLVIRVMND